MKFTKDNVYKLFSQYRKCADYSLNDLQDEILKLDDKPEKVVVPKFVAEWIQSYLNEGGTPIDVLGSLMSFHASFVDESVVRWFKKNSETMLKALTNGYTIEKEQQYIVSIMDLGIDRIILMKNKLGYSFELESENDGYWEVHFTEQQIKEYDKRYWPFATLIEEEEE